MKKVICGIILTILGLSMRMPNFNIPLARASGTIYIHADGSIDPLTAPISTFDNITYVLTGNIYESIWIERNDIVVNGVGYMVQGMGAESGMAGIVLSSVKNVTIKNINIRDFSTGIAIGVYSENITISGNVIENNGFGIYTSGSTNNILIFGNSIENNRESLWGYGIYLYESSNVYISGNSIENNKEGVLLQHSSNNIISENSIVANDYGIDLGFGYYYGSQYNVISRNYIINNGQGLYLSDSSSNLIYLNNFINNEKQADSPSGANTWDSGYPTGGNYWSNYNGTDMYKGSNQDQPGSDGIGDTPYAIDYQNTDRYPLMKPWTPIPPYKLKVSEIVRTTNDLNVRTGPGISYSIVATMLKGNKGSIISGPINADGYNWWKVNYDVGVIGWSADDWLEHAPSPPQPPHEFDSWAETALTWAEQRIGSQKWSNYCLKFVANAFMLEEDKPAGWDSALDAARDYDYFDRLDQVSYGWRQAPKGAIIFFDKEGTNPYGHAGIYLGNGSIIHAYGTVKVNTMEEALGKTDIGQYLGWSYPPEIWRRSSVENQPPTAIAGKDLYVFSGDLVAFNASESYDSDGTIMRYRWDFGDGATAEGMIVSHRFRGAQNEPKTYTVTLTVEDNYGATATDNAFVTVKPLTKLVDVGAGYLGVSCWMKATYNWVGTDEATGENLYIISKIETYSGGISGAYQLFILRRTSPPPSIPKLVWYIPLPTAPVLRTYVTPFTPSIWQKLWGEPAELSTLTFQEGTFQGIGVTDTSLMVIVATGTETGITLYYDSGLTDFKPGSPVTHLKQEELKELWELKDILDLLNKIISIMGSPCELRIYDSGGHVTGLVNGEIKEEIPGSVYVNGTVLILYPNETYHYEVAGKDKGTYKLLIISIKNATVTTFTATEIPTSPMAIHKYTIDWDTLSQAKEGVTVQVDSEGDGTFEHTFTSDSELTRDEFILHTTSEAFPLWIVGVAVAVVVVATVAVAIFWRRRKQLPKKDEQK